MEIINKKISAILPVYNSEKTLDRCLRSIYRQEHKLDEIVIVDNGSNDNTKNIINLWQENLPIKYFKNERNMGLSFSLRRAINECEGELLLRIDSDDEWESNHIQEIIKLSKKNNAVLFATRSQYLTEESKLIHYTKFLSNDSVRKILMWDNPFVHSSIAFKKSDYFLTSGYSDNSYAQDYALYIELLKKGELAFSDKITVSYFVNSGSLSRLNIKASKNARFRYQLRSIIYFWKKHPFEALKILPILIIRMIFLI